MSFLARVSYTSNGSTPTFSFSFPYIAQSHIKAFVDGVEDTNITFPTDSSVTLSSTPANGAIVTIQRVTPTTSRTIDFQDGSVLTSSDLDQSADQNFFVAQETLDEVSSNLSLTSSNVYDANNKRIINVANPVDNQDAVTKYYLENTWLSTTDKNNINTLAPYSSQIGLLGVASVINDMDILGTSANVTNMATVASNITDVNSFANRYRITASNPTTSLDAGDLAFVTGDSVLRFYDGTSWKTVNTTEADITSIVAGTGLSGGGTSGDITLSVNSATHLASNDTDDLNEGSSNLYYTDARFDTRLGTKSTTDLSEGTNLYYTDSRFDTRLATKTTDNLTEGSTNLYYTDARADARVNAQTGSNLSLSNKTTSDLAEGTNLYYTDARVDTYVSGGSLSAIDVAGNAQIDGNLVVDGNLTISGTQTIVNTETINLADNQIVLNSNFTGATPTEDGGIEIERGTQPNKTLIWDESDDKWTVGSETFTAGTLEGTLSLGDNVKANFGDSNDLQIYHNGTLSYIDENGTGELRIQSNFLRLVDRDNLQTTATFDSNGVNLRYQDAIKFTTTSAGATVSGNLTATGNLTVTADSSSNAVFVKGRSADDISTFKFLSNDGQTSQLEISSRPTTGIFNHSTDTSFRINNTEVFGLDSSTVKVNETGADVDFIVEGTSDTNLFHVDAGNNRVGIGSSSLYHPFTVDNSSSAQVHLRTGNPAIRFSSDTTGNNDATRGFIGFSTNSNAFINGSAVGDLNIRGATSSKILFGDNTGAYGTFSEDGVGIGTTSPADELHISTGDGNNPPVIRLEAGGGQLLRITGMGNGSDAEIKSEYGLVLKSNIDDVHINTGSTERVTVKATTGKVGIGTSSPDRTLHVKSATEIVSGLFESGASTNQVRLLDSATTSESQAPNIGSDGDELTLGSNGAERLRIDEFGRVGIGKTNPTAGLEIGGDGNGNVQSFKVNASTNSEWFSVGVAGAGIVRFNSQGGTTRVGGANDLGARMNIAQLSAGAAALAVAGGYANNILEVNSANSDLGGDVMVIDQNGKVGIGTTSPSTLLHLSSSDPQITITDTDGTGSQVIKAVGDDLTVDAVGQINLDAGDIGRVHFMHDGTAYGEILRSSQNFQFKSLISDGDFEIHGNDGGAAIRAFALDMSEAGRAHFNSSIAIGSSAISNHGVGDLTGVSKLVFGSNNANDPARIFKASNVLKIQEGTSGFAIIDAGSVDTFVIDANQNVSIPNGNLTLGANLDVSSGTIKLDGNYPTGTNNVALGNTALDSLTSGNENTAIGANALTAMTTQGNSTAIGYNAASSTTGGNNTAIGSSALNANVTGTNNTVVGKGAARFATSNNNTAVGHEALDSQTGGYNNTAVGQSAGSSITSGNNLTVLGYNAEPSSATATNEITLGDANVTSLRIPGLTSGATNGHVLTWNGTDITFAAASGGASDIDGLSDAIYDSNQNMGLGDGATDAITTGVNNIGIGENAITNTTTGNRNIGIGKDALKNNTEAWNNVAVGSGAGENITSGDSGVFLGFYAGRGHTTEKENIAIGAYSMSGATGGERAIAIGRTALSDNQADGIIGIGYQAGANNTTGSWNTYIGYESARLATTGSENCLVGMRTGWDLLTGGYNTVFGTRAGENVLGSNNTLIGWSSGSTLTTGSNVTTLGYDAEPSSATATNEITLGNASVTSLRIPGLQSGASSGDILTYDGTDIGLSTPTFISNVVEDTTPQLGGDLDANGNNINFGDNEKAQFGDSNDLQIFHNANNSIILDNGAGSLSLQSNGTYVGLYDAANTNHMVLANVGGDVQLYHNGSQKLATTASGVTVTGSLQTQDLVLNNLSKNNPNSVDGTRGHWRVQEGAENLYLINETTGKKYKFKIEEVQ